MNKEPSIIQIQEVIKLSKSIQSTLESIGSDLPKQTFQTSISWIQYFQSVDKQFEYLHENYSEVMIICYSYYINEAFKTISNINNEAEELNKAIDSFNFIDAYTKILREIQGIIDFINFLQSHPIDFNKSLLKSMQILEKIVSKNEISDSVEEINHIIRLVKKIADKENSLFDDYDKIQVKLVNIRTKIFNLYEKSKKKNICKAFNYVSLACYYYFSFTKPNTSISTSIFRFIFLLQSFSISIKNSSTDKSDLLKWGQTTCESIQSYSILIKDYNNQNNESEKMTELDIENKEVNMSKLKILLNELDDKIESSKGLGFDKLRSRLSKSKADLMEKLEIDNNNNRDNDDEKDNEEEEKQINLVDHSKPQKDGKTSVYSSFYSDDLDTKYTKSLPLRFQRPRFSAYHASPLVSPISLSKDGSSGQSSTFATDSFTQFSNTSLSAREKEPRELSTSEFSSLDLNYNKRRHRKNLTSSHSIFHLSPKVSSSLSSSSFSFRVSSRKPILVDDESPIKIKPSGRHLTFLLPNEDIDMVMNPRTKRIPSIKPYPSNVDTELLMPFIPNPPFSGWNPSYLLQKVTFSTLPTINYNSIAPKFKFSVFNFHLPSIKQLIEETNEEPDYLTVTDEEKEKEKDTDKKQKNKKKKKSLIHFRKKKKGEKQSKDKDHEGTSSFPKKKSSWFKKSEMDKKSSAVIKEINITLRKCWKDLRNVKNKNDQFGRLQSVSEWYKTVYSYVNTLVRYSKDFPNNEFIVDAVREYERIRVEFDEILNEIEFIKGQTMVESIQQSAKQLSMILVSLDIYINDENVASKSKLLSNASKVMGYLTNVLCNLQIICDCLDPSSFIACSEFIFNLWSALKEFNPIFSDLESYVKRSILAFSARSILLTLKPAIMLLYQITNSLNFQPNEIESKSDPLVNERIIFSDDQIEKQVAFLKKVSDDFLSTTTQPYTSMITDLFREMINIKDFMNPLFITDLNELGNVVESSFIDMLLENENNVNENDNDNDKAKSISDQFNDYEKNVLITSELKNCMTALAAIRKLQYMLTVKLGDEFHDQIFKNEEENTEDDDSSSKAISKTSTESDTSNEDEEKSSSLITNREFVNLVTQNEADFSELAELIQVNSSELYSSNSLRVLTKNWFESIFQITFGFVDLLKVSPILNKQPYLYSQVDSYYEHLLASIQFFKNIAKAKINVTSILDHLMANLKHTQNYSRVKPFEIKAEEDDNSQQQQKEEEENKKKKDKENKNLKKFDSFPLFETQFDLEKYKCGFFVRRVPIYKRALFADFIQSIITKLREPHNFPQKTMDYLTSFFIQVFTSLINISNQLRKDEERDKESPPPPQSTPEKKDKKDENQLINKDYFLILLINRERDNILHFQYSEEKSTSHYGEENQKKLIFLLSIGDFLAKFAEFASVLSDDDQKREEESRKKRKRRRKKKNSTNSDHNSRQRRGRVGEEFTIEGLTISDSDTKITDSDLEDNNNETGNDNAEGNNNNNNNNSADNSSDNYSGSNTSENQTNMVISKDGKVKLKELRQSCRVSISYLKKFAKKQSKLLVQPFNLIIRAKPANARTLFMSSENLSSTFKNCLEQIQLELSQELEKDDNSYEIFDQPQALATTSNNASSDNNFSNSIIISKNESSCSVGDNENDKNWIEIKETFDSIINPLISIKNDQELFKSTEQNDDENDEQIDNNDDDDEDKAYTAGVYFEQIYSDINNIPLILECSFDKSARLFSKIAQKVTKYAQKSIQIRYSESLTTNLIEQFTNLLHSVRNRYLRQYKKQKEKTANNEEKNLVNFIINEKVESEFELLRKTAKILLQRELIEKSNDQNLILLILSQKLVEEASNLYPTSEDYSFVLKTIMNMSVAVLNFYNDNDRSNNMDFESLKMFVASFDYFIETFVKEMDNEFLSDEILLVINEFEKLPMHIPGYYAPKLCLRFLLIEADIDEDENDN